MNKHALGVLEYSRVLDVLADRATSAPGAARIRALEPRRDIEWMETEQRRVVAMRAVVTSENGWHPEPIPDLTVSLGRLRALGSTWTGDELGRGAQLLRSSRRTKEALGGTGAGAVVSAVLHPFVQPLVVAKKMEDLIEHAIDPDGSVRDEASGALRRLRRELRGAQGELVQLLERAMAKLDANQRVPDMSVTMRNGRYVIPVRREGRAAIGGIVHDESATRGTVFVEPPAAIEFGNRIRALEAEERDEVERVLAELTEAVRPLREQMVASLEALIALDTLYARARFAEELGCAPADFGPAHEGFHLRDARHPLLLARGGAVVPFDLEMEASERTLLLSGPNTGGKTVLLKAVGLISALAQSGIPAPVGAESRIPIFDDCFADIGDEQSIQASLSTFSAHLRNLGEILAGATGASLVLIDELGSGTDPAEGAALGGAILDELTARGVFTIATTHLGALKLLATENPGVVHGSLQFDSVALAPTYRLIKGIPGRSYGLSIARRLHLPEAVLQRAESRLSHGERDVAALLGDLQERERVLAEREEAVEFDASRAAARLERMEARDLALREAERVSERRAREEARRMLLEGRAEIERTVRELREHGAAATARDARRRVEELAATHAAEIDRIDAIERVDRPARRAPAATGGVMAVGDTVEMETLDGRMGQIVELRNDQAIVAVGALKMTVPVSSLSVMSRAAERAATRSEFSAVLPEVDVSTEIDLRGMRVDEMELALQRALDAAIGADLHVIRIIHGKGTGALRERVDELLRADRRVREHRPGAWNEGGTGVTIAELA
ncbi:MAG: Smr/MutS family protein [Gemmatimonadota bacterium]|nr:Smr/MutS family protein [Gemmatimonadota bacterium]